jgi:malonate transporter and related proteins
MFPMLSLLAIVLPIFALILAGWLARRGGALGPHATGELNRFVVYLALPAMLFDVVANADWHALWQPGFIAAFGIGAGVVFVVTVLVRLRRPRHIADAAIDGLNAAYANTGFVGFPLAVAVLGQGALPATLVATIITVCILFAVALVLIEFGVQAERHPVRMLAKVGGSLVRNPLLLAPVLGALVLVSGLAVPAPLEHFLKLLGSAASPCALVALGLFLAEKRPKAARSDDTFGAAALLVTLKLVAQPLLTWLLAVHAFHLAPPLVHAAVLLAALPTGTGPFMLAEFYRREASLTSAVVLASTIVSLVTITAYLTLAL